MGNGRSLQWETDSIYTERQITSVLRQLGVGVEGQTDSVFTCYCPYHGNHDTPSFAVNKTDGTFICFNPSCARTGNLIQLIKTVAHVDDLKAKRMIARSKASDQEVLDQLTSMVEPVEEFPAYEHPRRPNYMAEI